MKSIESELEKEEDITDERAVELLKELLVSLPLIAITDLGRAIMLGIRRIEGE